MMTGYGLDFGDRVAEARSMRVPGHGATCQGGSPFFQRVVHDSCGKVEQSAVPWGTKEDREAICMVMVHYGYKTRLLPSTIQKHARFIHPRDINILNATEIVVSNKKAAQPMPEIIRV